MDLHNQGRKAVALHNQGRLVEAETLYRQILATAPRLFPALYLLGTLRMEQGDSAEAVELIGKALAINPGDVAAQVQYANALSNQGRYAEAVACFDRVLTAQPGHLEARFGRSAALRSLGHSAEALAGFESVLVADPNNADAWNVRGVLLREMRRCDEALESFERAIALRPDFAGALQNRGDLLWSERLDYDAAVADLGHALALDQHRPWLRGNLLHLKMYGADWTDFDHELALTNRGVRLGNPVVHPFIYQAISESPDDLQKCSRIYTRERFPAAARHVFVPKRRNHDKIRLGYVSGEFRAQAVGYLMVGLYECHDRAQFEVIGIDCARGDGSPTRARLEKAFDRIIPIKDESDQQAAALIAAEEIDILINLNGHFGAARTGLFAMRPAPLQVSYMGFPATMGASYMDYVLADRIVISEDEQCFYDEKIAWLPETYWVNDSKRPIAAEVPTRAACGLPDDAFVFCNMNSSYKLTPGNFALWLRILKQVPNSVLWLHENNNKRFAENLRREAMVRGIEAERLIFAPLIPSENHLARLTLADLSLDSLPYNAHTTAADILWAGVPILTCRGTTWPGRVGTSLLLAMNLPELVVDDPQDYVTRAVGLARNESELAAIRAKVAENRLTTALFDTDRFRRHMEAAYLTMWRHYQAGQSPESFCVGRDAAESRYV